LISQKSIEELKSIIDIVEVIGNYLELKKVGSNYKALCPFHSEKTPSFVVSPTKQIYHCFGCHAKGDAIKFVMEYEKVSFTEAIEKIASMYNFKLEYNNSDFLSLEILEKINSFYISELYKTEEALNYLKNRGVEEKSIEKFNIGYAPSKERQLDFVKKANLNLQQLIKYGVFVQNYPRLIERITFPIFSQSNKIIAFGGRTIKNHPAKYINFSNTSLFNKSKTFYGLNFAKEHILRKKEVIITEGYLDVIMMHQANFQHTIATLGTALTPEHLPILKQLDSNVLIAYDSDTAGINAALKASKLLYSHYFNGGVILFENGKDPADLIKEGIDISKYLNPIPFLDFIIEYTINKHPNNAFGKKKAQEELKNFANSLDAILKDEFIYEVNKKIPLNITQTPTNETSQSKRFFDIAEATIIKTLYENKELIDHIVEYLDPHMFKTHQKELKALYEEDYENPYLLDIVLEDDIITLSYEQLKKQLIKILIAYYQNELEKLKFLNLDLFSKTKKIKEINFKIKKLKEGELVESDITI